MSELVINFNDVQETLEPYFSGKIIKVVIFGNEARLIAQNANKKQLKARGILNNCANPNMIQGEKGAWERAVIEQYANDNS